MNSGKDVHTPALHGADVIGYPVMRVAHSRKVMKGEDKSFAAPDVTWRGVHFSIFGLFDGHGGKTAAEHCVDTFVPCILAALDDGGRVPHGVDEEDAFEDRIPQALVDAFAASDAEFLTRDVHSGATATLCVVNGRNITSAAVGDSLATLDAGHG